MTFEPHRAAETSRKLGKLNRNQEITEAERNPYNSRPLRNHQYVWGNQAVNYENHEIWKSRTPEQPMSDPLPNTIPIGHGLYKKVTV